MTYIFKNLTRGYLSLILLKTLLIGTFLTFNGCETSIPTPISQKDLLKSRLKKSITENEVEFHFLINKSFGDKIVRPSTYFDDEEFLTNEDALELLAPILKTSKDYLSYFGINNQDLQEEYGLSNDPRLILVAFATLALDDMNSNQDLARRISYFGSNLYAQTNNIYFDCALEVLGLNIGVGTLHDILEEGIEKVIKNLIKKSALRLLGPIGVAITVAHYTWCITHPE